jgi:hypothetical protein
MSKRHRRSRESKITARILSIVIATLISTALATLLRTASSSHCSSHHCANDAAHDGTDRCRAYCLKASPLAGTALESPRRLRQIPPLLQ